MSAVGALTGLGAALILVGLVLLLVALVAAQSQLLAWTPQKVRGYVILGSLALLVGAPLVGSGAVVLG